LLAARYSSQTGKAQAEQGQGAWLGHVVDFAANFLLHCGAEIGEVVGGDQEGVGAAHDVVRVKRLETAFTQDG